MAAMHHIECLAFEKAKQSECRYRISAVGLDKKGNVVGSATNKKRFDRQYGGLHAEIALIEKYGPKIKTIFICRINKNGNLMRIDPCEKCASVAKKLGIKIYSIR